MEFPDKEPYQEASNDFDSSDSTALAADRIVRHIMVIGFHHKHGYQVDYCFPPLRPGDPVFSSQNNPISLPSCWKTLPLLCLPDGSHNYNSDTIYFTMPDEVQTQEYIHTNENTGQVRKDDSQGKGIKTIFGTACYRQIQADKLLNRTDDMTRIAVQKSVCVLSTKPLFGIIRSKLEMITHAYFEELDFSQVRILRLTYDNLNSLLSRESVVGNATFLGLSARQLISQFGSNTLLLFKAMLLEKKILFYKSPVRDLCSTIMSMCSIFPGLLENGGLDYSTCDLQLSTHLLEVMKLTRSTKMDIGNAQEIDERSRNDKVYFSSSTNQVVIVSEKPCTEVINSPEGEPPSTGSDKNQEEYRAKIIPATTESETGEYVVVSSEGSNQTEDDSTVEDAICLDDPQAARLSRMKPEECGLPLQIFTRNSFCLPYLSISYLDLLADTRVKSFVIGATNFLFKQRREMYDVVVDMEENSITINDTNLKKCLNLTTEDLRFMDYLCKHVKFDSQQPQDEFDFSSHDIADWVGGDEWIRYQFRIYLLYLLKASLGPSTLMEPFNTSLVRAWKQTTNNYRAWEASGKIDLIDKLQPRHPFSASSRGLNFNDMRLKLSYAVQSSERGRIINQTLNGIGRWSIWNNIASAAIAAGNSAPNTILAAFSPQQQPKQESSQREDV